MKLVSSSIIAIGIAMSASAQNLSYGADNFYHSGNVSVQPIKFQTRYETTVAGNMFYLKDHSQNVTSPALVVGHPMGAVKEQSANLYAAKMAEQGFITVSLDTPFWGLSEGEPRNGVLPDLYSEAFSAAVDYLGTRTFVDRERIGGIGICGSGGFLVSAAKLDPRFKAIATASMYDMGTMARQGLQRSQSEDQLKDVLAEAASQRWIEVDGGPVQYTGGTINHLTTNATAIQREFYDYYRTKRGEFTPVGSTPDLTTHPTLSSNIKFVNFYPFSGIETISPRPMLFISGDQAHSREFSENAYSQAAEPKELFWIPGAGHVDLYDRTELIPFNKLTDFFRSNLS